MRGRRHAAYDNSHFIGKILTVVPPAIEGNSMGMVIEASKFSWQALGSVKPNHWPFPSNFRKSFQLVQDLLVFIDPNFSIRAQLAETAKP